jgi:glycosyltransferase involved in cell wall biosynthesis
VKSIIVHHYWGSPGGGQLVCASAAISLNRNGFEPLLTGTFKFEPSRFIDWYGIDLTNFKYYGLIPFNIKALGLLSRLYVWRPAKKLLDKYSDIRVIFTDEGTYKPLLRYKLRGLKLIEYIHFPFEVVIEPRFRGTGLAYGEDPYLMERYGSFPMNIYWDLFVKLLPRYMRNNPFVDADLVLTNSMWTARIVKMVFGEEPYVLNPPIPPNVKIIGSPKFFDERFQLIIMLGRFSEEKRYHWVVGSLMPALLKQLNNTRLVIFGGATTHTQRRYVNRIIDLARKAGLGIKVIEDSKLIGELDEKHQVYLRLNAPRAEINEIMDVARVFLHATINEHWGIAVAEAMARGLPIVVHKSGGAWTDLAMNGEAGLGYDNVDEAVENLSKMLTDANEWSYYSQKSLARVAEITFENFVNRLNEIVKGIV